MRKWLILVLVSLLALSVLAGCGQGKSPVSPPEKGTVTISDSTGVDVTLPRELNKIVVLNMQAAEALRLLQVSDEMIIGVDDNIRKSPYLGFDNKVTVGSSSTPNIEKIVELKPQAVIAQGKWWSGLAEFRGKIEPLGIKVVALDLHKTQEFDTCFINLAKLFAREERAREFLNWKASIEATLSERLKNLKQEEKVKVFQVWESGLPKNEWSTSSKGRNTAGTGPDYEINMAGGINIAHELNEDYPKVSGEWVLQQNPGIIVVTTSKTLGYTTQDYAEASKLRDIALQNKVIGQTNAGKSGQIFVLRGYGNWPYICALYQVKWFYPDRFKDIEPGKFLEEYFEKWLGVPYKGKWVFPE